MKQEYLTVYVQSEADAEPGHAGVGLVMTGAQSAQVAENVGIASAEQALYQAVILAFDFAGKHGCAKVRLLSDSAQLLEHLRLRHCPDLGIALSSLHKRAVQSGRCHHVKYQLISSADPNLIKARELAHQAMLNPPEADNPEPLATKFERHALQQSAGGVLYKRFHRQIKVCLIAKKGGKVWALPKGRLQAGESWEGAAIREVLEETGHLATIAEYIDQLDYYFYWADNHTTYYKLVAFFLMPLVTENMRKPDGEADKVAWFDIGEAMHRLHYPSERNVLRQAHVLLRKVY